MKTALPSSTPNKEQPTREQTTTTIVKTSPGVRMEYILKSLRIPRSFSYVDAAVLDTNTLKARELAKKAIRKKMETKRFFLLLLENAEARQLYYDAVKLDVNDNVRFLKFIEIMETVLDLLGVRKLK